MAASLDSAPKVLPAADGRPGGRRRYPGARPFEDSPLDHQVFCGRAADVERLYQRVLGAQLLVLFSKSGLGKTSLLNAGLFPRLREKAFLPVPIRLNGDQPASQTVIAALVAAAARPGTRLTAGDASGLWEYLRTTLVWRDGLLLTPVLVFDQFEEVFTLRDASFRDELAAELGALACGLPPLRLQAAGGLGGPAPEVKILLSLREEYLGTLQEISLAIPGLFQERVRLAPLADGDARLAIVEPAARVAEPGDAPFKTQPFEYTDQALQAMLAFLRGDSKIIEPFQLQLLCGDAEDKLAARLAQGGKLQVSADDLGGDAGMDQVLRRFYAAAIMSLPSGARGSARRLCEEGLISATGRRLMLDQTQISSDFGLDANELALLVDERLLRRELRLESMFYEISHDRLADSINRQRKLRIPKRLRLPLGVAAVALVAGVAMLFWVTVTVRQERDLARDAAVQADLARDLARDASRQAIAARETADQALAAKGKALDQVRAARTDAENVVAFLIGDSFLEKLRPVGRNEILDAVQKRVQDYIDLSAAGAAPSGPRTRGLALRNQADLLRSRGRPADAVTAYRESAAAFATASDGQADQARSLDGLSEALLAQGKLGEAVAAERAALALRAEVARRPGADVDAVIELSESHSAVGRLLNQMGRPRQALGQHLDQALALLQPMRKSAAWSPHLHKALHEALDNRAEALTLMANGEQARAHYQEAFKVAESWLKSQPLAADARQRHLVATSRVANDMIGQGELAPAVERYQAIHQAVDELVRWDPSNEKWKRDLEATRILLAQGWTASGKYAEAHAHFDTALAGLTRQQALDRSSSDAQTDLGWLRSSRGALAKAEKIWRQAVTEYAASARHYAAAAAAAPNSASIGQSHYLALRELAIAQDGVGRHAEALATLHQGRDLVSALIKAAPEMTVAAFDLQTLLDDERDMLARQGKPGEGVALAAARRKALADALAAAPNNAELWNRVHIDEIDNGDQAAAAGKPSDAVAAYQRAIAKLQKAVAIDGRNAVLWSNLRNAWTRIAGVETKRKRIGAARLAYANAQAPCERAFELSSKPEDKAKYALRLHDDQLALGELEAGAGDKAAAIRSFALARDWIGKAGVAMPAVSAHADSLAEVQRRLAVAAAAQGDKASAAAARRAAGEAAEKAVAVAARHESADDQGLRLAALQQQYADTAEEQIKQGEAAAAVDSLKAGIAALGRSAAALPKSSAPQRAQQHMQARLAELLEEGGDQDAGLAQRRASVETALQAAALDGTADDFFTVAQRQFELGRHFVGRESWGDALAGFRQGVAFSAKAIALDASNGRHQMAMAYCQRGIGEMLARTGQDADSRTAYEAAVAAGEHAVALSPDGAAYWQVLVMAQRSLAVHLDHLGRPQAALAAYGAALKSAERAASRKDPYDGAAAEVQELRELITKRSAAGT